jgi:hypothetical protein
MSGQQRDEVIVLRTLWRGALCGLAGTAVMTYGEKLEQRITGRPDSYVPARTASRLFGLGRQNKRSPARNLAMHYGTGAMMGVVRAAIASRGTRGIKGSLLHFGLRFTTDDLLENAVGTSRPPWTWPPDIAIIDVAHKAVYAFATGVFVDSMIPDRSARSIAKPATT